MKNNLELIELLLKDMEVRFANELVYDPNVEKYYFKNTPRKFLLWSARNKELANVEKEYIFKLLVDNKIIFNGNNMRWYTNVDTFEKFAWEVASNVTIN
jgi:hypothetical protein